MKEPQKMHGDLEASVQQLRAHAGVCSFYLQTRAAPGKPGLHARGEGERVLALESREGTRASRRVEEGGTLGVPLGGTRRVGGL